MSHNRIRSVRLWHIVVVLGVMTAGAVAWFRVGLLDLPSVPAGTTLESSGLSRLAELRELDRFVREDRAEFDNENATLATGASGIASSAAKLLREGYEKTRNGEIEAGLEHMRNGLRMDPNNLVLSNAYRMAVFQVQARLLAEAHRGNDPAPQLPPHIKEEPMAFLAKLASDNPSREVKLSLALAWVDHMLLYPALEIKAPSSVEAVNILTSILDQDPSYVPALFARGMNHLHRPARLVWPESQKTPLNAAATDIGGCIAIGRKVDVGSSRLQATLAIAMGDSCVKCEKLDVARSWWQLAQNLSGDDPIQQAVRRRYGWKNENILDELERELDRARSTLDHPMTDLALMWN